MNLRLLGTLSTHAILKGVGVGSDVVNPLSATVTWVREKIFCFPFRLLSFSISIVSQVLKDGAGHFGKIIFAWWKG